LLATRPGARPGYRILAEGLRSGAILSVCFVVLALLGLTQAFTWIAEVPLVGTAIVLPIAVLIWTGYRAAIRSDRLVAGPLSGALAGVIGGGAAGIIYLLAGKPALNVAVGLVGGAISGAACGFAGALFGRYRTKGFRT
jgi:hypothetical protein